MVWILYAFIGLILITTLIGYALSTPPYEGPKSDHFDGKRFINPNGLEAQNLLGVFKYFFYRKPEKWISNYETDTRIKPIISPAPDKVQITFVNHSTFLLQIAGVNILTDPVWSKRCSPFQWAGPARMRPPGFEMDLLPKIDYIFLSHNHYDHLDVNTIKALNEKHRPKFIVPLGVDRFLSKLGISDHVAVDWNQSMNLADTDLSVKGIPASHFTSRGLFDRDKSLWCGYLINWKGYKVYFAGDSGYGPNFKKLGKEEGEIDLALIPIGAYKPEWFMSPIHISPSQAVQVHRDINSKQSIAMHFGTFPLADDAMQTPIIDLKKALTEQSVDSKEFIVPDEGESYVFMIE